MDEYIDVKIDVFEHTGQRARLRKNLTVVNLIEEVLKEFDDIVADSPCLRLFPSNASSNARHQGLCCFAGRRYRQGI